VHPAATVVLLRDGDGGVEVLLGRRSSKLAFHGGAWVFPGGRIDDDDYAGDRDDVLAAAKRAAAREALEEAGLHVDAGSLVYMSKWTTPAISPKRFATWFFAGRAHPGDEIADGAETEVLQWFRPAEALEARAEGEIELAPPQFVTLVVLQHYATADHALRELGNAEPFDFAPRFHFAEGAPAVCLYPGDVAYDDVGRIDDDGARHRLVMGAAAWDYVRR
jgi:8-oxo-dGTP pyrophosphatase MutT (NUDIX family)